MNRGRYPMKNHLYIFSILLFFTLNACSGGPAEKPLPVSITSPARLLDKGVSHYENNNYAEAIDQFEKALLQYRSIDNQTGIAKSCMNLAKTYMAINNNQTAAEYLAIANTVIKQASLDELNDHLHLLNSSLAINKGLFDHALQELKPVLSSKNTITQLAALKNRTRIAFLQDSSDRQQWLEKYKSLQQNNAENTSSHLARILRFEAELSDIRENKAELLMRSLSISKNLADRPAIAATLTQWAQLDIEAEMFEQAEDKLLRALFIRHQLTDVKNSLMILKQLQRIYAETNNNKQQLTNSWIKKISNAEMNDWQQLFSDFETYPMMR